MILDNIIPEEKDPSDRYRNKALHGDLEPSTSSKIHAIDNAPDPKTISGVSNVALDNLEALDPFLHHL